jgi:hypothetical protein
MQRHGCNTNTGQSIGYIRLPIYRHRSRPHSVSSVKAITILTLFEGVKINMLLIEKGIIKKFCTNGNKEKN